MRRRLASYGGMIAIVVIYWLVAGLYAIRTPDWQAPDEPAHYNYVRQVTEGRLPIIEDGDWDSPYLESLKASRFDPALLTDLPTIEYEDHQPPLYYVLAAPVYLLTDGDLTALRLFSVLIGTIIVVCAYGVGMLLYPIRPWIGMGAAAFVAYLPQHVAILASVNNDSLGWALVAVTLLATVAYVKSRDVKVWQLGLLVGICFITKATTYFMAGVVPLAIMLHWWTHDRRNKQAEMSITFPEEARSGLYTPLLRDLVLFALPALIMGLAWWGRDISVYGFPDFMGLKAHNHVVADQGRTADLIENIGFSAYVRQMGETTFHSFIGQFGWMGVVLPDRYYVAFAVLLVIIAVGWVIDLTIIQPGNTERMRATTQKDKKRATMDDELATLPGSGDSGLMFVPVRSPRGEGSPDQRNAWIILSVTALLSVLAYFYYNSEFLQFQARYMFTGLIPLGLWLTLGLEAYRRIIVNVIKNWERVGASPIRPYLEASTGGLIALAFMPLAVFDLWLLWKIIVPNL